MQKNTVDTRTSEQRHNAAIQDAVAAFARLEEEKGHYKTHCALKDATITRQDKEIDSLRVQRDEARKTVDEQVAIIRKLEEDNARMSELLYGQPTAQSV